MKKIIVPIDFSKYSEFALETGAQFANKFNAELIVMHMLELSDAILSSSKNKLNEEMAFMLMVANKKFETFLDQHYLEGVKVTPMIKHHKVLKEVSAVASEIKADLIVMGSRGHSTYQGVFTGSNTEKVVRHSNTPVIVVKSKPNAHTYDNIVLACDFSEESIAATKDAYRLLNTIGNQVSLLHVNMPNLGFLSTNELEKKVDNFVNAVAIDGIENHIHYVSDYNVEDGVLTYASKYGIDTVAVITEGRTGLNLFFSGSTTEDIVNHAKLPVITFKLNK